MDGKEKIGLGMYTIHRAVKENMAGAIRRIAQMGYRGIEFFGEPADFSENEVSRILQECELSITGWHIEWKNLQEDSFGETIRYLLGTGCETAIIPCLGGKWNVGHDANGECRDRWLYYTEWMNQINDRLKKEGIKLGYHNHEHEFQLRYDGKTVFDLLFENLAPDIVMEFDTGNCIEGGEDPVTVLNKYKERRILLHLKPYSGEKGFHVVLGEDGDANDWQAILHQSEAKFDWLLLESENDRLPEMENAQKCLRNLKKYL